MQNLQVTCAEFWIFWFRILTTLGIILLCEVTTITKHILYKVSKLEISDNVWMHMQPNTMIKQNIPGDSTVLNCHFLCIKVLTKVDKNN